MATGIYIGSDVVVGWVVFARIGVPFEDIAGGCRAGFEKVMRDGVIRKGDRVSVSLTDRAARMLVLPVDDMPSDRDEARDFLAWRLEKLFPNPVRDCDISFQVLGGQPKNLLVCVIKKRIIEECEGMLSSMGLIVTRIGVSSLNVFNLFHDNMMKSIESGSGFYFLYMEDSCFTIMAVMGGRPEFIRTRQLVFTGDTGSFIAGELKTSVLMHAEKTGRKYERLFWFGEELPADLKEKTGISSCRKLDGQMLSGKETAIPGILAAAAACV